MIGSAVGTAVHAGAAYTLQSKLTTGLLAPVKDVQEVAVEALRTEIGKEEVSMDATTPNLSTAQLQVNRMALAYQLQVAPHVKPVFVEHQLEAPLGERFLVSGSADVGEDAALRDTKTGVSRRTHWPQFGTYSLLARAHNFRVESFTEDFVRRGRISAAQPDATSHLYDVRVAEQMAQAIFREIEGKVLAFERSGDTWVFMPNPSSMLCTDKYCPAWGTKFCRAHRPD